MFDSCTKQTKITTAIVIAVTILCIIGEIIFFIFSPCKNCVDQCYEEDIAEYCKLNTWLLILIIFAPALIGFIILGIRICLDRKEVNDHDEEANKLNTTRHIVNN